MMKKVILTILILFTMFLGAEVYAKEFDGYIVRVTGDRAGISLLGTDVKTLGDGLYKTDSIEEVYANFNSSEIVTVIPDYYLELYDTYPEAPSDKNFSSQWNHPAIGAEEARRAGVFGDGVKIAILDSGLDVDHEDLKGANILPGYNSIIGAEDTSDVTDNVGHGSHVAGIIAAQTDNDLVVAGIASRAEIMPIKVTDTKSLSLSALYTGINKAIEADVDIINMSMGGEISLNAQAEMKRWIDAANDAGIICIAAGGNSGSTAIHYPAGLDNVIGVGYIKQNGTYDSGTHRNQSIFITAPGSSIPSLKKDGGLAIGSGSSYAAPHVTGAVALIKQLNPYATLDDVKQILIDTSVDAGEEGYDIYYGHGILSIKNIISAMSDKLPAKVISQGQYNSQPRLHIHNNESEFMGDTYLASYSYNILDNLEYVSGRTFPKGVTSIDIDLDYDCFFLWMQDLTPVTYKYNIVK